ncbi:MAG: hypothetical protein SH847_07290 [Roseiflexaceae bacterium]|nr:hypothetical protein [Roseiflexaceae bacterium]
MCTDLYAIQTAFIEIYLLRVHKLYYRLEVNGFSELDMLGLQPF